MTLIESAVTAVTIDRDVTASDTDVYTSATARGIDSRLRSFPFLKRRVPIVTVDAISNNSLLSFS